MRFACLQANYCCPVDKLLAAALAEWDDYEKSFRWRWRQFLFQLWFCASEYSRATKDGGPKQSKCVAVPFGVPGKKAWCLWMLPIYRISDKQMALIEKKMEKTRLRNKICALFSIISNLQGIPTPKNISKNSTRPWRWKVGPITFQSAPKIARCTEEKLRKWRYPTEPCRFSFCPESAKNVDRPTTKDVSWEVLCWKEQHRVFP